MKKCPVTVGDEGRATERMRNIAATNDEGERREPAADDVEFVSARLGWLPLAAPPWAIHLARISRLMKGSPFVAELKPNRNSPCFVPNSLASDFGVVMLAQR
jgi:hypothetical protein